MVCPNNGVVWSLVAVLCMTGCGGTVETEPGSAGGSSGGGSSTGGSGGTAASGGTGATGGGAWPECKEGSECTIFRDCCTCTAYGPNEDVPPSCAQDCFQDACSSAGIAWEHEPVCSLGQCIVGVDCDPADVFCNALPPNCEAGMVPSVVDGCWGDCIDATQCLTVSDCDVCTGAGQLCVNQTYTDSEYHCVEAPAACDGDLSTSCLCPLLCPNWNFCNMQSDHLQCDYI